MCRVCESSAREVCGICGFRVHDIQIGPDSAIPHTRSIHNDNTSIFFIEYRIVLPIVIIVYTIYVYVIGPLSRHVRIKQLFRLIQTCADVCV